MSKILSDFRKKSLLVYILSFSAIVVLIILVLGIYLYRFYYHTIYIDFKNGNKNYISAIYNRHENDFMGINNIMAEMGIARNDVEFKLEDAPLKSIALKEQIYRYASVNQFFNQIFFFYHGDKYLYNHSTSIDINMFLEKGFILELTSAEEFNELMHSRESGMKVLKEQGIEGYLSKRTNNLAMQGVIYLLPVEPQKTSTLVFVIGDFYYDKILKSEIEDPRQNLIFYGEELIVSRGELDIDSNYLLDKIRGEEERQFQISMKGQKYLVSLEYGKSGLLYCTVQSIKIFQNKILTEQWGILFLLLVCSIPTSLAIVTLSRQLSKKVKKINALLNEGDEHPYDLEHIEIGIRTLVKHNKEVHEESLLLRRTRFINNFVRNEYKSREAAVENGAKVNLKIDRKYYMIVLMGDRGNSNEGKAHGLMLDIISRRSYVDGYGIHLIHKNQSLFVVFGDDTQVMVTLFEEFYRVGLKYCENFIMSTSGYHEDYTEASEAYLEADTAFDCRFLVDNSKIIYFSDLAVREHVDLLPEIYTKRLKNAIRACDKEEARVIIEEICNQLKSSGQSLLAFRILCNDIAHMMVTEWNTNHTDFINIYSVFSLSQCLTVQDFNDILWEICCRLLDSKQSNETKKTDFVDNAIQYMKTNYGNPDLNMSFLADYLKISGVTLAIEFKNFMGISPSDYLAMIRIENAKILLKETNMLVKEVSSAVGYEDDNVFTRRFKKYVGKTPGQYRVEN